MDKELASTSMMHQNRLKFKEDELKLIEDRKQKKIEREKERSKGIGKDTNVNKLKRKRDDNDDNHKEGHIHDGDCCQKKIRIYKSRLRKIYQFSQYFNNKKIDN